METLLLTSRKRNLLNKKAAKKVLIVEDDLFLAALVGRAIYDLSTETDIDWATSLEQALGKAVQQVDHLGESPYEFVIADIMLEGHGTGLDLWKVFCKTYPQVPVMVISSLSELEVLNAIGPEVNNSFNFLKKPFSMAELKNNLREVYG